MSLRRGTYTCILTRKPSTRICQSCMLTARVSRVARESRSRWNSEERRNLPESAELTRSRKRWPKLPIHLKERSHGQIRMRKGVVNLLLSIFIRVFSILFRTSSSLFWRTQGNSFQSPDCALESYVLICAYRVIESVLEQLVTWAAAALEKSSNQPVLPHAIIVLNASPNFADPDFWNVSSATSRLLQSLSQTVQQNATFKEYALFWRKRGRNIKTVEELLLSYYSSVRVVRIPTTGRPNLIYEQVQELYKEIGNACASSRKRRSELRMLLDAVSRIIEGLISIWTILDSGII